MTTSVKTALCTGLAVAVFVAAYLLLRFTATAALAVSAGVLAAAWIAVPRRPEASEVEVAANVSQAALDDALGRIRANAAGIEAAAPAITDPRVSAAVQELARTSRALAQTLEEHPSSLRSAWDFIDYNQPQAARIVDRYTRLDRAPGKSDEEVRRLAGGGRAILDIAALFTDQLRALRAEDFAMLSENVAAMKAIALRADTLKLPARSVPARTAPES